MKLNLRPAEECTFDAVSLGEVMLRLDPGEGRIRTARSFGRRQTVSVVFAETVSTSQKEVLVSVVPRVALIELTQLFLRLLQKILILITSSRTRAMVV